VSSFLATLIAALPTPLVPQIPPLDPDPYNGDTVGIFVEPNNYTLLQKPSGAKLKFHFGRSNSYDRATKMIAFTHDIDRDGYDSLGYFNSRERIFYFARTNRGFVIDDEIEMPVLAGVPGPLWPVVLDWDGDDVVEVGVYQPNLGRFYLEGYVDPTTSDPFFVWATSGLPVVGDWDGDGRESLGLYSPSGLDFRLNDSVPPAGPDQMVTYGAPGAVPIVGDWINNGQDKVGYFDPVNRVFHRQGASTVTFSEAVLANFAGGGAPTDLQPLAGTWHVPVGPPEPPPYDWGTPVDPGEYDDYGFNGQLEGVVNAIETDPLLDHLNSLLVIRCDTLIVEKYYHGYTASISNHMMSTTKSVLSALYGRAITNNMIPGVNPAQPIVGLQGRLLSETFQTPWTPTYVVCGANAITLLDIMTMTSGFEMNNNSWGPMFSTTDYIGWILNGPATACDPGWWDSEKHFAGTFDYYGGNNHVGAEVLRRHVSNQDPDLLDWADAELFSRIGIRATRWDHEPSSNVLPDAIGERVYYGPSQMFMRPRDMARFGQLFLEGGTLEGQTILSQQWVGGSTQDLVTGSSKRYGCWWWLEYYYGGEQCHWVNGTKYCGYNARGFGGQHIYVFPGLELIVVMTADWNIPSSEDDENTSACDELLKNVLDTLTTASCGPR
jgi:hypothetical protein